MITCENCGASHHMTVCPNCGGIPAMVAALVPGPIESVHEREAILMVSGAAREMDRIIASPDSSPMLKAFAAGKLAEVLSELRMLRRRR